MGRNSTSQQRTKGWGKHQDPVSKSTVADDEVERVLQLLLLLLQLPQREAKTLSSTISRQFGSLPGPLPVLSSPSWRAIRAIPQPPLPPAPSRHRLEMAMARKREETA